MSLTKEAILAATKPRVVEVEVEAWGGTVRVRELTVADYAGFAGRDTNDLDTALELIARSVIGDDDALLFTREEVGGLAASRGAAGVTQLGAAIAELNGTTKKAAADIAKN